MARSDFFGAAREFPARQRFQDERRNQPVPEEGDFFGFGIHPDDLPRQKRKADGGAGSMQSYVFLLKRAVPRDAARRVARLERETLAIPAGGVAGGRTETGGRPPSRWTAT